MCADNINIQINYDELLLAFDQFIEKMKKSDCSELEINQLLKLKADTQIRSKLDKDLIEMLKELTQTDKLELYSKEEYPNVINKIDNKSCVIYFKRANIFKVYPPQKLQEYFFGQISTALRHKDDIYEVVNRDNPQKIIIIIDGSIESELNKIRNYIFSFLTQNIYPELKQTDITIFKNNMGNLEILINGIYVKNYSEKEAIIKQLLDYIENEEKNVESPVQLGKIGARQIKELHNADTFLIPERKVCVENYLSEPLHKYVSNIKDCKPITINNVINIVNTGNNNHILVNTGNIDISDNNDETDELTNFINFIKDTKPKWYKAGTWMFISELYDKFKEVCDSTMSVNKFSRQSHGLLFTKKEVKYIDKKQGRAVLLFKYDKL